MKLKDLDPVLGRVARKPNGAYRVLASRLLPGKILGGFKYYGTRSDDPNDVVPHEHRRNCGRSRSLVPGPTWWT